MNNYNFEAISYAFNSLPEIVLKKQKKVFNFFNLPLTQCVGNMLHGTFLEHILKTTDKDYIIFFDADCIPLIGNIYCLILDEISKEASIIGIEQTGQPRYHIYAGPACLGVPVKLYKELGCPSLNQTFRSDTAEELSWVCEEHAKKIKYFKVSHVEEPRWRLGYDREFGIGTTYQYNNVDVLYHQFESRFNVDPFLKKCDLVIQTIDTL